MTGLRYPRPLPWIEGPVAYAMVQDGRLAIVDAEDFPLIAGRTWGVGTNGYPRANIDGRVRYIHNLILPPQPGLTVDHANWVKLDNRRSNLRYATVRQNVAHCLKYNHQPAPFRGVSLRSDGKRWTARIAGRHLGHFDTPERAAFAYDQAALATYGEFAVLNFPDSIDGAR